MNIGRLWKGMLIFYFASILIYVNSAPKVNSKPETDEDEFEFVDGDQTTKKYAK